MHTWRTRRTIVLSRALPVMATGVVLVVIAGRWDGVPAIDLVALAGVALVLGGALLAMSHRAVRFDLEQHIVESELVVGPWRHRARYRLEQFRAIEVVAVGRLRALLERGGDATLRLGGPISIELPDSRSDADSATDAARTLARASGLRCEPSD